MIVQCASCGSDFEAIRATARYCSGKCRKRAADVRSRSGGTLTILPKPTRAAPERVAGVGASMLTAYSPEILDTPAGQLALKIAADVDHSPPGAPGVAALVRELRAVLADLDARQAPRAVSPLMLIRERHASERASG